MMHFYNEHNAYRAMVLRERIADGLLPGGVVDERNIEEIPDETFSRYRHIHLFAGIGGFPFGMRLAGFPESISIVDGGFPCQDTSNAGKRAGITGSRSGLWREMVRCVRVVRPQYVFLENVAALLCRGMGEVLGDLAEIGYDADGDCISAADVGAPHLRRRIWIVAYPIGGGVRQQSIAERWRGGEAVIEPRWRNSQRPDPPSGEAISGILGIGSGGEDVAYTAQRGLPMYGVDRSRMVPRTCGSETMGNSEEQPIGTGLREEKSGLQRCRRSGNASRWPVEPNVGRVAHGIPKRVDRLAALGDAIVPQCVQEVIRRRFTL